ncbi:MAG: hypothetical protein JXB47_01245 [Anaerolineae bacterium]|nr:hypothetical protein [Anaerolineae bacterium]
MTDRDQLHDQIDSLPKEHLAAVQDLVEKFLKPASRSAHLYPPRIVAFDRSFWLREDGEPVILVRDRLTARRIGKSCVLEFPADLEVQVNGERLHAGEYTLRDGDFIRCGRHRFFFQADPVAARHKVVLPPSYLSEKVRKKVTLDKQGVTFHGSVQKSGTIHWEDILCLNIEEGRGTASFYFHARGHCRSSEFVSMPGTVIPAIPMGGASMYILSFSAAQGHSFIEWLRTTAPFDLSVHASYEYRRQFPDAYLAMAEAYIAATKALPAVADFIRGKPTLREQLPWLLAGIGGLVLLILDFTVVGAQGVKSDHLLQFIFFAAFFASAVFVVIGFAGLLYRHSAWRSLGSVFDRWLEKQSKE